MSLPKWLDKKESPRKFSQRREKYLAKKLGGKLTPNSGARWHSKGDMYTKEQLVEIKSTTQESIVVHMAWLDKIRQEAIFLVGHPNYYPRFGFVTANQKGMKCEFPAPDAAWMVLELRKGALDGKAGTVFFRPEFREAV